MLKDKFIALLKAVLLLTALLAILLFNSKHLDSSLIPEPKIVAETAINEEVERLQRNKIIAETTQQYRQQALEQEQTEYQYLSEQSKGYIKTLTAQQRKEQRQLDQLKKERLRAEQELAKLRQERKKLNK